MIEVVSATRFSEGDFWNDSALGQSLRRLEEDTRLTSRIAFDNQRGLPEIFNARITAPDSGEILVFVHDDVWIDDYFIADRVTDASRHFDVVGIAGNRRRVPMQASWAFVALNPLTWDDKANLSGSIAHGSGPFGPISHFGPVPAQCELLDGVLLAARKSRLVEKSVFFDPRFDFHFYDMDFCRSATSKGLRLGTWPICLTHQSGGAPDERWFNNYRRYLEKWTS